MWYDIPHKGVAYILKEMLTERNSLERSQRRVEGSGGIKKQFGHCPFSVVKSATSDGGLKRSL